MTQILPSEEQHLAGLTRRLVRAAGGVEAVHEVTGKCIAHTSRCTSPNNKASISLRDIALLESVTHGSAGHPIITRHLANRAGHALVKLPEVPASTDEILQLLARHSKESGDIASVICEALGNGGRVHTHECPKIRKEIWELIRILVAMDSELELIEKEGAL